MRAFGPRQLFYNPDMATQARPATVRYFTPDLFRFLERLRRNNRREWFLKHKQEYERVVRDPCLSFIRDFADRLYEISPHLVADARPHGGSLFRIYRDTRFSSDKRPYKTHVGMDFGHGGTKDVHSPGFYLHLEPGQCFAAAGLWHPENATLLKVRNAIVSRADQWREVRRRLTIEGDSLKRPPRGFPCEHEFADDLKRKDLLASVMFTEKQVTSPKFMDDFVDACRQMAPLARFLSSALGLKF